jgi:hypothetical protein
MPAAPVCFTAKAAVSLLQLLQKNVNGISLKTSESKKLDTDFEFYMEHYWQEVYEDTGTLQGMKELEQRPLDPQAMDHVHKVTKLDLKWDAEDTSRATASAEKLTKLLRDSENDNTAQAPTNSDFLPWMTFEVRYRCALESRPQKTVIAQHRGKSENLACAQIL